MYFFSFHANSIRTIFGFVLFFILQLKVSIFSLCDECVKEHVYSNLAQHSQLTKRLTLGSVTYPNFGSSILRHPVPLSFRSVSGAQSNSDEHSSVVR